MRAVLGVTAVTALLVAGGAEGEPRYYYDWTAPAEYAALGNPIPASPESVAKGKAVYEARCLTCHGPEGDGEGTSTDSLRTLPADLTEDARMKKYSDGALFWKIRVGRGDMPPWQLVLKEEQIWHVINFIRSLSHGPGTARRP